MTTFSVVMPTRNRAALFRRALESVLCQTGADFEIVVVNDGTSGDQEAALNAVKSRYATGVVYVDLPITATGHGCFRVMNIGFARSRGDYVCFLDDDDMWTDPGHLADADRVIQHAPSTVDAILFDQAAFRGDVRAAGPIWLEDLGDTLKSGQPGERESGYAVDASVLLTAHGFAHTNTTIVRRGMFAQLGGFDASLWYEGDRDFFLRLIDGAAHIRYRPDVCARHNIPDRADRASMTTTTSDLKKALDQVRLLHKAARHAQHAGIVAYARRHRHYALRKAIEVTVRQPALAWTLVRFLPFLATTPKKADALPGDVAPSPAVTPARLS